MKEIKEGTIVRCWDNNMGYVYLGKYKESTISLSHNTKGRHKVEIAWHPKNKNQSINTQSFDNVEPVVFTEFAEQLLPEGVKIGDKFVFYLPSGYQGRYGKLKAITSDGRFVDSYDTIWDQCKPLPKTKIVKPLNELMITLLDEGYKPDHRLGYEGDWAAKITNFENLDEYPSFAIEMFNFCGKEPSEIYTWRDSWLKEVYENDKD